MLFNRTKLFSINTFANVSKFANKFYVFLILGSFFLLYIKGEIRTANFDNSSSLILWTFIMAGIVIEGFFIANTLQIHAKIDRGMLIAVYKSNVIKHLGTSLFQFLTLFNLQNNATVQPLIFLKRIYKTYIALLIFMILIFATLHFNIPGYLRILLYIVVCFQSLLSIKFLKIEYKNFFYLLFSTSLISVASSCYLDLLSVKIVVAFALSYIFSALIPIPFGLGIREIILLFLTSGVLTLNEIIGLSLSVRFITIIGELIVGLIAYLMERSTLGEK